MSNAKPIEGEIVERDGFRPKVVVRESTYTTKKGLVVKLTRVDPVQMNRVIQSVKMPKRPTYETVTASGRVESHVMDEQAAKETPGGIELWKYYIEEKGIAASEQNDRLMRFLFHQGTEATIPEDGWRTKWEFAGIEPPPAKDVVATRAFYLANELESEDVIGLTSAILRLGGVDEKALADAEAAFLNPVRAE